MVQTGSPIQTKEIPSKWNQQKNISLFLLKKQLENSFNLSKGVSQKCCVIHASYHQIATSDI